MFNTEHVLLTHKEWNSFPPEVVEEYFWILAEEDAKQEKRQKMKQQLSIQWQKSRKLYRLAKTDCWSDDDIASSNDVENQPNDKEITCQLWGHSNLQYVKGKDPNFDTISLLKGGNGLK